MNDQADDLAPPTAATPLLVVLTGPSGVGKDAILSRLQERGHRFYRAITATTRPQRAGEENGRDYLFLSEDQFQQMQRQGELLEHAEVYGYRYGVPKAPIRQAISSGLDVIVRTDIQGAATIKAAIPPAVTIFVAPGSPEELRERLRRRGTETEQDLERRLAQASHEMAQAARFDHVVVNRQDDLDEAVEQVQAILAAARRQPSRQPPAV